MRIRVTDRESALSSPLSTLANHLNWRQGVLIWEKLGILNTQHQEWSMRRTTSFTNQMEMGRTCRKPSPHQVGTGISHGVSYIWNKIIVCILLYCTVIYWRGDHCCPMHCDLFKIDCAPPNLVITETWICRLNFAQRPIFSGLRFFNEPEISDSGLPA